MTQRRVSRKGQPFELERLEIRQLLSADVRSIDGTGNNLVHTDWGSTGVDLLRKTIAAYADGISSPAGADRASARLISDVVDNQDPGVDILNNRNLSAFVYAWGQFIDHDMDLTGSESPAEAFNISVPSTDTLFDPTASGTQTIDLNRSQYDPATGTSKSNPPQQTTSITAWIDASMVYGSDQARANALRTFIGGKLKTTDGDLLPFNTDGLANANDAHIVADDQLFLAGDVRANENVELTSIQTLFMREHNRLADQISADNPNLTDEQIYQRARALVIGEVQSITYNEFLPALLGQYGISPYRGYNPNVNPGITNEFSTAAFRLGHSMVGNDVEFLDNNGQPIQDELSFAQVFFNPPVLESSGVDPILKYLASDKMQEIDTKVVDPLRNFLFGAPGQGGFDLASLNIQRGRDNGLADYNTTRAAYGLPRVKSFAQITSDPTVQAELKSVYGSVDNIDLWVGGLAEDHAQGSSVGPLFQRIIADQFQRLRDGDRFWFERQFSGRQLSSLENTTLADIIERNTGVEGLQDNVFFFNPTIRGTVFVDPNNNGQQDWREFGLPGITVQLLDGDGNVLQTTTTRFNGSYSFDGLDIGTYQVREVAPAGWKQTTADPASVQITSGTTITGGDIGLSQVRVWSPQPQPRPQPGPGPWQFHPGGPSEASLDSGLWHDLIAAM